MFESRAIFSVFIVAPGCFCMIKESSRYFVVVYSLFVVAPMVCVFCVTSALLHGFLIFSIQTIIMQRKERPICFALIVN